MTTKSITDRRELPGSFGFDLDAMARMHSLAAVTRAVHLYLYPTMGSVPFPVAGAIYRVGAKNSS